MYLVWPFVNLASNTGDQRMNYFLCDSVVPLLPIRASDVRGSKLARPHKRRLDKTSGSKWFGVHTDEIF